MLVFVQAWEGIYQGLHGIEDLCVIEVSDDKDKALREIDEWGSQASEELIYQFGLEEEYFNDEEYFNNDEDDEMYDITDTPYYEGRGWRAYKIKSEVTLSQEELDILASKLGAELFIQGYCEEEAFVE